MFIQTPSDEGVSLAVLQDFHLSLSGQIASAWGSGSFDPPDRFAVYMSRNHDAGWQEDDWAPDLDPATGLPYHIMDVPPPKLVKIHKRSIARNYAFHPYAGILGAMHTMGFYTGRLGTSDFLVMDSFMEVDERREVLQPLVEYCREKIEEWKAELAGDPECRELIQDERLFATYRLFQAFDTMSLFFCLGRERDREPVEFPNVPTSGVATTTVTFAPTGGGTVEVDPYPFASSPTPVFLEAKVLRRPFPEDTSEGLRDAPVRQSRFPLVARPVA